MALDKGVNGNVQDLAGNASTSFSSSFKTAATANTTPPAVTSIVPSNGATGVGQNPQIVITFSESVSPSTLTPSSGGFYSNVAILASGSRLSFSQSISADNRTLTLSGASLPAATVITVVLTHGITDLSGNALADYESQFTTAASFDTTHATVVSQRPASGATGVPVSTSIVLFLNKVLNAATVPGALHVSANGQLVNGTVNTTGNGGQTVQFTPSAALPYGALMQVFLDATAQDTSGNAVTSYQASFTTVSNPTITAPAVLSVSPAYAVQSVPVNPVIHLVYSEPVSAASVNAANVFLEVYCGGTPLAAVVSLDATGTIVQLKPNAALSASQTYCVQTQNIQGTNGLAAPNYFAYFSTGAGPQTTAPAVTAVSPSNQLTNVPVNANIRVLFSGAIDPTTVNDTTIQVTAAGSSQIITTSVSLAGVAVATGNSSTITFGSGNQLAQLTPQTALPASTQLTLTISGVKDVAGNVVATQTTQFTTGTAPSTAGPLVIAANPPVSETGVPVNAAISLQMNEAVDPTTVNGNTYRIYDNTLASYLTGTYSQSTDDQTVYFVPATSLATGRTYQVIFNGQGMTDLAGNNVTCCGINNYSFTTGFTTGTTGPAVTSVNPANGLTGVPLNAQIVVQFSEPVNSQSLSQVKLTAGGNTVNATLSLGNGNQTLVLIPAAQLLQNTTYTLTIAGVTDLTGNPIASMVTSTFKTGTGPDFTVPTITAYDPASGATNVPLNALVRLRFSKQVVVSSSNFYLYPNSTGLSVLVKGSVTATPDGLSAVFMPGAALQAETIYCTYLTGIVDLEGQALAQSGTLACFTTGVSAQTTGPSVTGVSPPNGATGVAVNAPVEVQLSEPASVASVGQSAIAVTAGGAAVAGTVSVSGGGTLLTFTPSSALAVSTAYQVTVGGFVDVAGNPAAGFMSGFTTSASATPDKTAPTVTTVNPANSATNVAVTTAIVLTFSKAVNPLTVTPSSMVISAGGEVAGTYAVSGATVTFTPQTQLPASTTVSVGVNGNVQDLAGNASTSFSSSFKTAATANTTPPAVTSIVPSNGATGVGQNPQIVITFSESVSPSTLTPSSGGFYSNVAILASGSRLSFSQSISADNRTLTLSGASLPAATVITVVLTHGITDLSGNALADYESQFTTAASFDTTHATVVSQRPASGATGVPVSTSIVLFLNKVLNAATVPGALHVSANGQLVNGTVNTTGNGGQTVQFTPSAALPYGALMQVFLDATAQDTSGNAVTSYQASFTTVSNPTITAPAIVSDPLYNLTGVPVNAVVEIGYSEPLNLSTLSATNVYVQNQSSGANVAAALSLDTSGTVIRMTPNAVLAANTEYCYYIQSGVQGVNGLAAQQLGACFTTGAGPQTTAPAVTAVSPSNQLTNVPVNANIRVLFSGAIDPLTVNDTTVQVTAAGSSQVITTSVSLAGASATAAGTSSTITFGSGNQLAQLTPQTALPASTQLTLTISGVKDVAGNVVATQTTQFTTGTAPSTAGPLVIAANPPVSETGVPVNAAISLQMNEAVDPTTVNGNTYRIYDNTLASYLTGAYSQSTDDQTVYFVPATSLATGRTYQVIFNGQGMTDLAGNNVTCCGINNYSFTTGVGPSTTPPSVTGVSPASGLTGVPLNAQILVQFSEPVNSETLGQVKLTAGGNTVNATLGLSNGNQTLLLTPAAQLLQNTPYTLVIFGVTDLSGNSMTSAVTSVFTTGSVPDFSTPNVVSIVPANQAVTVGTGSTVQVQFSKLMDRLTVSSSTFTVMAGATAVAGTVSTSSDGTSAVFTPTAALAPSTIYAVKITGGVFDLTGQALVAFQSTFTTGTK